VTQMTAVSLFAGIGGLDHAFARTGVRVAAAVEIDVAARGVIHDRMPDTALFTDVRKVTADELRAAGFDPDNGVLLAGWPCQDLSVAGRRLGLGGARSELFWEIVRLLADLRPRWFCLENVPGLLSAVCPCLGGAERTCGGDCDTGHPVRGGACGYAPSTGGRCMELHGGAMGAVLGALAELGYGVAYRVLDAQHFGVPQRRRRVVLVGCAGDWAAPVQVLLEPEGGCGDPAAGRTAGTRTAVVAALRAGSGGGCGPDDNDATGGRLIAGAITPGSHGRGTSGQPAEEGHLIVGPLQAEGADGRGHRIDAEGAANGHLIPTLTASMGSNVGHPGDAGKDDIVLAVAATLTAGSAAGRAPGQRREDDENLVAAALTARQGKGPDSDAIQTLVPVAYAVHAEHSTAMTGGGDAAVARPVDLARSLDTTGGYATNQGGTVIAEVAFALRSSHAGVGQGHNTTYVPLGGERVVHALTAEGADASEDGTGRGTPLVPVSIAVNQDFSTGEDIAQPITGSNGQPGTIAVPVAFDWKTDGSDRARPNISTEHTSTLGTTKQDAVMVPPPDADAYRPDAEQWQHGGVDPYSGTLTATAVRRLTPTECERLQGFPDGWTATSWGKPQSDSARYRQLGNSVAVPVFRWVARRIVTHLFAQENPA
jgi:DNA (cytosine-5)-methyltransferase 1